MKIIYLDIDGVLNSELWSHKRIENAKLNVDNHEYELPFKVDNDTLKNFIINEFESCDVSAEIDGRYIYLTHMNTLSDDDDANSESDDDSSSSSE